ncbi:MAG: aspartyl protease family protein [Alphaproteobacteria bacterium]|nr:aspartyl protease family protein [Alphaproteobacteria bacterium]
MPCLTGVLNNSLQAIIDVAVAPTSGQAHAKLQNFRALIDTGANRTCITAHVVQALSLSPIGKLPMRSASHTIDTNIYMVDLGLPFGGIMRLDKGKEVMECCDNSEFEIIIGMDIISQGTLTVSPDNRFIFCL